MSSAKLQSRNICENCFYFVKTINAQNVAANQGMCMRNPPQPFPMPTQFGEIGVMTIHPSVGGKDWCGEWKKSDVGLISVN
jgi:hypothetical protein